MNDAISHGVSFFPNIFRVANFPDKWQKLINLMSHLRIPDLYRMTICLCSEDDLIRLTGETFSEGIYEEAFRRTEGWPLLSRLMKVDQLTYLPDAMLTKVDRASMAVSLEVRVPLLDHRVVEYTSKLPDSLKYRNGTGKYLLKKLLARYVPVELFERPKMGFGVPIDRWFRSELKDLVLDYLSPERLRKEGLFDQALVEKKKGTPFRPSKPSVSSVVPFDVGDVAREVAYLRGRNLDFCLL